jgi:hypothetical protein
VNLLDIGNVFSSTIKEYHDNPWRKLNRLLRVTFFSHFCFFFSSGAAGWYKFVHQDVAGATLMGICAGLATGAIAVLVTWQLSDVTKGCKVWVSAKLMADILEEIAKGGKTLEGGKKTMEVEKSAP